jgi:hypothetical protein
MHPSDQDQSWNRVLDINLFGGEAEWGPYRGLHYRGALTIHGATGTDGDARVEFLLARIVRRAKKGQPWRNYSNDITALSIPQRECSGFTIDPNVISFTWLGSPRGEAVPVEIPVEIYPPRSAFLPRDTLLTETLLLATVRQDERRVMSALERLGVRAVQYRATTHRSTASMWSSEPPEV